MKIVYYVDYFPSGANSVADILHNSLYFFRDKYSQSVVKRNGYSFAGATKEDIDGIPCYSAEDCGLRGMLRSSRCTARYLLFKVRVKITSSSGNRDKLYHKANVQYLEKMLQEEKPDMVVSFCFSPDKDLAEVCMQYNVPYCYALYDTYLSRPNITPDTIMEEYVIQNSVKYLIPNFFYPDYEAHYKSDRIMPYALPLLIPKEQVEKARKAEGSGFQFVYFGQLQAFRSAAEVTSIFHAFGCALDVFTNDSIAESDALRKHDPIKGDDLYATIAHSDFLVAMDNNAPYENYLPSKVYLYVSFGKPVIVFGNNGQSAIRRFMEGYPCWYYHKIGESLDGLTEFIENNKERKCDNIDTSPYEQYLPENSLNSIYQQILKALH